MNIRPLASSGKLPQVSSKNVTKKKSSSLKDEDSISQVDFAKARASWGRGVDRSVSFDPMAGGGTSVGSVSSAQGRGSSTPLTPTPISPASFRIPSPSKQPKTPQSNYSPSKSSKGMNAQSFQAQEALDNVNDGEDDKTLSNLEHTFPSWQVDLYDLFYRTNGDDWKEQGGWPSHSLTTSESNENKNAEIYGVNRPYNRPEEVVSIDLCWNNLQGDIGQLEGLWKLKHLEILHLGANRITGVIPGFELRSLALLKELHLYRNGLHGQIPSEIGQLRQLTSLWLFENHLTGKIDSICELTSLTDLKLNSNRLSGQLPAALAQCTYLKVLNLQKNQFTGAVTEDIILSCGRLRDLRLWDNKLTGALTAEINALRFLEVLLLQQNELSWIIPPNLGKCEHLVKIDLSKNKFRGELPKIGTLQKLEYLNVSNNTKISGKIPREIQQLPNLTFIDVSSTMLSEKEEFKKAMKQGRTSALKPVEVIIQGFEVTEE